VLIDMQGKAARGTADLLYALSDDIVYCLENHGILVDLPERSEYEKAPEFTFSSRFLRDVVEHLDSRNLLLMFDEFEELQKRVEDGRLEPDIFPFLRNLMQHEPRLDFLFSGTHKLEELGAEYWSILFNIATYKHITFLDADEVRRLVTEPVAPYGLEYDPLAVERIIQVTAGHPYFAQVVCHEMVAYHNEVERNYLTVTSVDHVLERIIERGEAHFKYIWAGATQAEPVRGGKAPGTGSPPGQGHPHPFRHAEQHLPLQNRPHPPLDRSNTPGLLTRDNLHPRSSLQQKKETPSLCDGIPFLLGRISG
jgi:hypothetical protein